MPSPSSRFVWPFSPEAFKKVDAYRVPAPSNTSPTKKAKSLSSSSSKFVWPFSIEALNRVDTCRAPVAQDINLIETRGEQATFSDDILKAAVGIDSGTIESMNESPYVREWPENVEECLVPIIDTGVFVTELSNADLLPKRLEGLTQHDLDEAKKNPETLLSKASKQAPDSLTEGTYRGTQLALRKVYDMIEKKYSSFMDVANFEPTVPSVLPLEKMRELFIFTDPQDDNFPPHLNLGAIKPASDAYPGVNQKSTLSTGELFSKLRLAQLTTLLPALIPKKFVERAALGAVSSAATLAYGGMGTPDSGTKIADVENYNKLQRKNKRFQEDIFDLPNIGDLPDWYSDARFAQQHFSGANPTTIQLASHFWVQHFIKNATDPQDKKMYDKIKRLASERGDSLYMQDYSYFRRDAGLPDDVEISCDYDENYEENDMAKIRKAIRYAVASVCLFHLTDDGQLEPLAVVIDWRGSSQKSVTIYNKELNNTEQKEDWAWRYAKTCVQSSDWIRHEVTVHLTNNHLVEEATIVGAYRNLPQDHIVFQLLYPHWQKTLSLNAAARTVLVPQVIVPLIGMPDQNAYKFIQSAYNNFDFVANYIPNDLNRRGFPTGKLNDRKYHNYTWARCIHSMWYKIRAYVEDVLRIDYSGPDADAKVAHDVNICGWYKEMQTEPARRGAGMKTFPTIKTLDDLIDVVTMCIHLASPQHNSVSYLQHYYQAFVVNKPPCLYAKPPTSIAQLRAYTENDLVKALPINHTQEWLLASNIPYLLSFKPSDKGSLIIYAASKYHVYKFKHSEKEVKIKDAAARFYESLARGEIEFKKYAEDAEGSDVIMYDVFSPIRNAVSIRI